MSINSNMRKILLFFISGLLIQGFTKAQFVDSFTDGNFTSSPTWTGDVALYKVNTEKQLQLNSTISETAALSAASSMTHDMEWHFWIKLSFAPSDNNLARIYLTSDQSDLKGPLNGYYLKLGETGSNDAIELVQQSGNIHTVICRGTDGLLAAAFTMRIKVVRAAGGSWTVYADELGGTNYKIQASGTDNTITNGSYLGVYSKFTSSNSTRFYYDDFYAGPVLVDNLPPEVVSVSLETLNNLSVTYSEPVEASTATNLTHYSTTPGSLVPLSATPDPLYPSVIHLSYTQRFTPDVVYSLDVKNVKDLAGNVMTASQTPFSWHQAITYDILINEIMADPTPLVNLPETEYVELYNRSAFPVDLQYWSLWLGSTEKMLPQYTLPAGGYVILCDDASKALLAPYGPVIDFSSFAVTNGSGTLTLKDFDGNVIHSVSYTEDWFKGSYKKDGGWSLELIDPLNPCGEASNWMVCNNQEGGTPGKVNSVKATNPDLVPPAISRVGVDDPTHVTVWFTETCDNLNTLNIENYTIDNGIGIPVSVSIQSPGYKVAHLTLQSPLANDVIYSLTILNKITDCAGNPFLTENSARFAIPVTAGVNDIIINELLFDPTTEGVDFVEIFNRSAKVIDLKDLVLANYDTIAQVITDYNPISAAPFLMFPSDFIVLSTDSSAVKKCYKTTNPKAFVNMAGFPSMNNEDGIVAITTKGGDVIDIVAYTAAMQYPLLTSVDGVSLERISPERASEDATNWHSAAESVGFATPGYKNSQFGVPVTDANEITLSPDIFSPDNDGYNDNLAIAYTFASSGNNINITIYDATGRLVRNLVNHVLCGTSGAFTWDGITNDMMKASIGRYIVFVEIFDLDGNVKRYKKGTVLGGKL